jgi:hypothetical protein
MLRDTAAVTVRFVAKCTLYLFNYIGTQLQYCRRKWEQILSVQMLGNEVSYHALISVNGKVPKV